jgi:hypothetical protein
MTRTLAASLGAEIDRLRAGQKHCLPDTQAIAVQVTEEGDGGEVRGEFARGESLHGQVALVLEDALHLLGAVLKE